MQIQRIQTVYLFLAAVLMAAFGFLPAGMLQVPADPSSMSVIRPIDEWGLALPVFLSAVMLLIDIFLYRNLSLQRNVLKFAIMFTVLTVAVVCFTLYNAFADFSPRLSWAGLTVIIAFIFELLAFRGINHDDNLLRSADRLR